MRRIAGLILFAAALPAWAAQAPEQAPQTATAPVLPPPAGIALPPLPGHKDQVKAAVDGRLPLDPQDIRALKKRVQATQAAIHDGIPPVLKTRSLTLSLSPGAPTPVIHLVPGFVTSVQFSDATGAPWPLASHTLGAKDAFEISAPASVGSNVLTLAALTQGGATSLVVTLKDQPVPLVLMLDTPDPTAPLAIGDARVDLRVPARGPGALPALPGPALPPAASTDLQPFLDATPPAGAQALRVKGDGDTQAWRLDGQVYLRSPHVLLSPAFQASIQGSGDMRAYRLAPTPVVLVDRAGTPTRLELGEMN